MKYCTQCGKPNADESKFCYACGKPMAVAVPKPAPAPQPAPTPQPMSRPAPALQPVPANAKVTPLAKGVLKEVLNSGLFFAATILFSVLTVLTLINSLFNQMALGDAFSDFASEFEMMNVGTTGSADLTNLIFLAPYGLICAGLWVLFAQGKKAETEPIGTVGIQLTKIGTIIHMSTGCGLLALIVILLSVYQFVAFVDASYEEAALVIPLALMLVAGVLALMIFTYIQGLKLLNDAKRVITSDITDFKVSLFFIVMCYVEAGVAVFMGMFSESFWDFLLGACQAAFLILIALCLTKYKKELSILKTYLEQNENKI